MIITLCGSARFEKWFHVWNEVLTLSGHTVFGLSVYPSLKKGQKNWYTDAEKKILDKAHFQKIDASDAILVLNKFAYVGESTLREIEYAQKTGKKVYVVESWGKGYGVCSNHIKSYQDEAKKYQCFGVPSPIDLCYAPAVNCCWDLLPRAGSFRTKLVERIYKVDGRE